MVKTVTEPNAELLNAKDLHQDVVSLTEVLEWRCAEQRTYDILNRKELDKLPDKMLPTQILP